jgi:CRP-like cAMP-binding protein
MADAKTPTLFAELTEAERARVFAKMEPASFAAGEVLFHQSDPADGLYLIDAGAVEIVKGVEGGKTVPVAEHAAPALVGEMGLLEGRRRSASVKAKTAVSARRLSAAAFRDLIAGNEPAAVKMLTSLARTMSDRLAGTTERLAQALLSPPASAGGERRDLSDLRDKLMKDWTL